MELSFIADKPPFEQVSSCLVKLARMASLVICRGRRISTAV